MNKKAIANPKTGYQLGAIFPRFDSTTNQVDKVVKNSKIYKLEFTFIIIMEQINSPRRRRAFALVLALCGEENTFFILIFRPCCRRALCKKDKQL